MVLSLGVEGLLFFWFGLQGRAGRDTCNQDLKLQKGNHLQSLVITA